MQRDRWSVCSSSDERRRGTSGKEKEEEGIADHHLTSETKETECEKRARRRAKQTIPVMSLCDTADRRILRLEL